MYILNSFWVPLLFSEIHISYFRRVETQDGGDANIEVSPRDIVYMEPAEPLDGEKPQVLLKLDFRYRYQTT
jgi:hypothetical protein